MCLVVVAFFALTYIFVISLIDLSFDKEDNVVV